MKPAEWLRTMARRERKPATGGYVQADQMPALLSGCEAHGYLVYSNPTIQVDDNEPELVISLTLKTDPTEQQVTDIVDALRYSVRSATTRPPSYSSNCGCWPTYMYCYCDLRKPTPQ